MIPGALFRHPCAHPVGSGISRVAVATATFDSHFLPHAAAAPPAVLSLDQGRHPVFKVGCGRERATKAGQDCVSQLTIVLFNLHTVNNSIV